MLLGGAGDFLRLHCRDLNLCASLSFEVLEGSVAVWETLLLSRVSKVLSSMCSLFPISSFCAIFWEIWVKSRLAKSQALTSLLSKPVQKSLFSPPPFSVSEKVRSGFRWDHLYKIPNAGGKEELRTSERDHSWVNGSVTDNGGFALGFWFAPAQDQPAVYSTLVLAHASLYCRITFGWSEKEY